MQAATADAAKKIVLMSRHRRNLQASPIPRNDRRGGLLDADLSGFPADHRLLAGDAPVIAGERAALAERAMARHHERDRVLSDRSPNRARGLWRLDPVGDIRIADRAAHR